MRDAYNCLNASDILRESNKKKEGNKCGRGGEEFKNSSFAERQDS